MASYKYEGNDDFRGYVAANVEYAKNPGGLLGLIGNDGRINWGKANQGVTAMQGQSWGAGNAQKIQDYVSNLWGEYQGLKQKDSRAAENAALLAALAANRTPVPRMVNFDVGGSWDKAREMATKAVSPVYQQKMTDFINRQQVELGRKQSDITQGKSSLDQVYERFIEDANTNRGRAQEDRDFNVDDIEESQAFAARTEGLSFDAASRALSENLGASGTADSGLGRQQVTETEQQRNMMSNEQIRQSENKIEAQNTLMNRTFEDLTTATTRKGEDTTSQKSKLDLDMERFIEDQAYEKDQTEKQNRLDMEADVAQQTIGYQGQLVDQWIQSLSGKGYTAQEIANAASIYR